METEEKISNSNSRTKENIPLVDINTIPTTEKDTSDKNTSDKEIISGVSMYVSAVTAILGAGILYMPASISEGGMFFALIGILLCAISSFYISKYTHKYIRRAEIDGGERNTSEVQLYDLLPEKSLLIRRLLKAAIALQASLSIIVYLGLIRMWSTDVIVALSNSSSTAVIISIVTVLGVLLAGYLAISNPKKPNPFITSLSAISSLVLMIIIIAMFITIQFHGIEHSPQAEGTSAVSYLFGNLSALGFLSGMSTAIFAINSQNYIPMYLSKFKSKRKITYIRVPLVAVAVMGTLFLVVGVFGKYILSIPGDSEIFKENALSGLSVLVSYLREDNSKVIGIFFWLLVALKLCMISMLFSSFMWNTKAYRDILLSSTEGIREVISRRVKRALSLNISHGAWVVLIGSLITISTVFVVYLGIDTKLLITVVGGVGASYILLFIPAYLVVKDKKKRWMDRVIIAVFLFVFVSLLVFVLATSAMHAMQYAQHATQHATTPITTQHATTPVTQSVTR
ncbi:hypothetical protein NEFER03_0395 [Nematocida sp. LUAm3]|nr:hypothetical protein NEFER03_0395 [Nematocida sp. LUAm3]KAI5175989.1 hypothetical protein NEFER02_1835 [Nematocida sp. LUAm2]KAI5179085.1 hypothetical protein NEFER01_1952 [Nematocida sp. LUAm1]